MKKAQISLFMIIGVVLFIIVIVFISIISSMKDNTASIEGNIEVVQSLRSLEVNNYVNLCMENALRGALDLAGKQGGVIYETQFAQGSENGKPYKKFAVFKNLDYDLDNVTIVEYQNQSELQGAYCPLTPNMCKYAHRYPYDNYLNSKGITVDFEYNSKAPYFKTRLSEDPGLNYVYYREFSPLCNSTGTNMGNDEAVQRSCETYSIGDLFKKSKYKKQSMQSYIESYMLQNLSASNSCLNGLNELVTTGVEVVKPIPSLLLTIHEESLEINMRVPIKITTSKGTTIETIDYSIRPKVRLKYFHEMIDHSIGNPARDTPNNHMGDESDIFFDITKNDTKDCSRDDAAGQICKLPGMSINRAYEAILNQNDNKKYNIYVAEDNQQGFWPLKLYFAVGLRRPVLEPKDKQLRAIYYPTMPPNTPSPGSGKNNTKSLLNYQLSLLKNTPYSLEVYTYDANEYNYSKDPSCVDNDGKRIMEAPTYDLSQPIKLKGQDPQCEIMDPIGACGKIKIECSKSTQAQSPLTEHFATYILRVKHPLDTAAFTDPLALQDYIGLNISVSP